MTHAATFLDALVQALETAGAYNKQDQSPPAAVLWPDKERQWEPLLPRLGERLPLFGLGDYSPDQRSGPAYWLRCIIARSIDHHALPQGRVPILYWPRAWLATPTLPGHGVEGFGAAKALLDHGWQRVVVVTDHGWLLLPGGLPKAELPEHLTEVRKGRCARLKDNAKTDYQVVGWHWDPSVRFAIAPGIHYFEAGKDYEHGGVSPQECVVATLTVVKPGVALEPITISSVSWRRLRCNVTIGGPAQGLRVDLRTKAGDPSTSLVSGGKELGKDGTAAFFVEDEDQEGQGAVVIILSPDGSIKAQFATMVGGSQ
jgi:hypothetical protein